MFKVLISVLLLGGLPQILMAQSVCQSGRVITLNFPTCYDTDNPNPVDVSCRHPAHGIDPNPASVATLNVISPWVAGGSGLPYDSHCRANLSLQSNQTAEYLSLAGERDRTSGSLRTEYQYTCAYRITTQQYLEQASINCVPESERYPSVTGASCLSEAQHDFLELAGDPEAQEYAVSEYKKSLGEKAEWAIYDQSSLRGDEVAFGMCPDCSGVDESLPLAEKYQQQISCILTLMNYDPFFLFASPSEKAHLKSIAGPLERALNSSQISVEGYENDTLVSLMSYIIVDL